MVEQPLLQPPLVFPGSRHHWESLPPLVCWAVTTAPHLLGYRHHRESSLRAAVTAGNRHRGLLPALIRSACRLDPFGLSSPTRADCSVGLARDCGSASSGLAQIRPAQLGLAKLRPARLASDCCTQLFCCS
jgi:hypothetical protein